MAPQFLTAVRYQQTPEGSWKSALVNGNLNAVVASLDAQKERRVWLVRYEDSTFQRFQAATVRLPDGRVYDATQGCFLEDDEVKAHA